ncbi:MAG TPA: metallopeptidase family protein [Caulobacterales bacterium]|nr:metallopeptidase family protein [Caulobacterales bacterium]
MADARFAPSLDDIEALAQAAWAELPAEFRTLAGDVIFRIEDFADEEVLAEIGIEDPFALSGLYHGVDLTRRSVSDPAPAAPMVFLYRRALLDEWIERGDIALADLVAHVLVHEVGHHFGFSDEQMDEILDQTD